MEQTLDFAKAVTVEQLMDTNGLKAGELGLIHSCHGDFFCKLNSDYSPVIDNDGTIILLAEGSSEGVDNSKPVMFARRMTDNVWVGYNPPELDWDAIW